MGIKHLSCKIAIVFGLLGYAPAFAEVPDLTPLNYELRYDVTWNGMGLGRIRVTVHEDAFRYSMHLDTKTRGIASLFSSEKSIAEVSGRVVEGDYLAQKYDSRQLDKDGRITTLTYDEEGKLKTRLRKPDDDPAWRPPVSFAEVGSATDPMTAFFLLRRELHDNIARNVRDTSIRTYEGARLASFNFEVISRARIEVNDKYVNAINIVPTRTQINGYTPKELKKFREKGDPNVHVYFSTDGRFIPLSAQASLPFGSITARLSEIKPVK